MKTITKGARNAGFTLIEVLLTLLIMSGIMVSIAQILTAARTSRDTIHNIAETQNAGPAILDMIERDLRGMCIYDRTRKLHLRVKNRIMAGLDGDSLDFVASSKSRLLTNVDNRFVKSPVCEIGYRLRPNPSNDQFLELWRRESFGVDDDPFEGGEYTFLHGRVKSFDIHIFADDGPDEEPIDEWGTDRAEENIGLPARLEITLVLELAPRLINEQLSFLPADRRTLTYKRIVRIPEILRMDEEDIPVPVIAKVPAATGAAGANGANPAATEVGGAAVGGAFQGQPGSGFKGDHPITGGIHHHVHGGNRPNAAQNGASHGSGAGGSGTGGGGGPPH